MYIYSQYTHTHIIRRLHAFYILCPKKSHDTKWTRDPPFICSTLSFFMTLSLSLSLSLSLRGSLLRLSHSLSLSFSLSFSTLQLLGPASTVTDWVFPRPPPSSSPAVPGSLRLLTRLFGVHRPQHRPCHPRATVPTTPVTPEARCHRGACTA